MDNLKNCSARDFRVISRVRDFNKDDVSKWAEVVNPGVCKRTLSKNSNIKLKIESFLTKEKSSLFNRSCLIHII